MRYFLIPRTGEVFRSTYVEMLNIAAGDFFMPCNEQGNTCIYNGDAVGHSKGFCTADACY